MPLAQASGSFTLRVLALRRAAFLRTRICFVSERLPHVMPRLGQIIMAHRKPWAASRARSILLSSARLLGSGSPWRLLHRSSTSSSEPESQTLSEPVAAVALAPAGAAAAAPARGGGGGGA